MGEREDQCEEGDIELSLHRHRPDVLQRTDRLTGAKVVRCSVGQLPVLEVPEACQALVSKRFPARLRLDQDRQHRRCGEHDDQRGQQPANESGDLGNRPQRRARRQRRAQQTPAEEETRQRQEDVDAARNPAKPHVKHRDERNRDAAKAVEIVSVETRCAYPRGGFGRARGGTRIGDGRRPGRGEGDHGRRPIYRRSWLHSSAGDGIAAGEQRITLLSMPALTPDQISAIDAAHVWHPYSTIGAEACLRWWRSARSGAWLTLIDDGRPDRGARRDGVVVDRDPRPRPPGAGRGDYRRSWRP